MLLFAGCADPGSSEADEFGKLESALLALGAADDGGWPSRLEDVKSLDLRSARVVAIRATCTAAYEKFGEATRGLAAARADVARLEAELARATDGGAAEALGLHEKARRSTEGVTASLDDAERLVNECGEARRAMREELVAR